MLSVSIVSTVSVLFPKANIGKNGIGKSIIPIVNPVDFPNFFAIPSYITNIAYMLAIGIHSNKIYHHSFSAIVVIIYILYIGISDAHPGFPAFLNIFHIDINIRTTAAKEITQATIKKTKATPVSALAAP